MALAIVPVLVVFLIGLSFQDTLPYPFVLFLLAVYFASWSGGLLPGLLSIVPAIPAAWYFLSPTAEPFLFTNGGLETNIFRLVVFVLTSIAIVFAQEALRQRLWRIKQREKELEKQNLILEARVQERTEALRKSNEDLEAFAAIASHDLRAPLRAIRNLASWIEEELAGSDIYTQSLRDNFTSLRGRVSRMEGMIKSLLEYSRFSQTDVLPEVVNIKELIEELVELLNVRGDFQVTTELHMNSVITHKFLLQRIFLNLINNAIKHHDSVEKGVIIIRSQEVNGDIQFSVADNGPGIEKHLYEKAVGMFETLKSRDETEGSGMGLAIVKKIVESLGGRLELQSNVGRGLCVAFTFPKIA